ncbi:MAG: hypothetical protein WCQ65_12240, partial [Fermentimonas sp.]
DFVQTHTSQMMSVSILVRMPAIYILRRERVIRSVFVHVPVPRRAGVFRHCKCGHNFGGRG